MTCWSMFLSPGASSAQWTSPANILPALLCHPSSWSYNIKVHQHQKPTIWVSGGQLTYKSKHIRERSTRAINWRSSADIEVANGKSRGTVSLLEWAGIRAWSRVSRGSPTTPHKISGQILVLGLSILEELIIFCVPGLLFDMFEDHLWH